MSVLDRPAWTASPRWAWLLVGAGLLATLLGFGVRLGRYPLPMIDESFFTQPALHHLAGQGFLDDVGGGAPAVDRVWSFHSPVYPRLLAPVLRLAGVSELAARLPQFLAWHLAWLLLLTALLRRGLWREALLASLLRLGDRALLEVLYARPDGLAFLWLAAGFVVLLGAVGRAPAPRLVLAGALVGGGAACHPTAVIFVLAAAALLAVAAPAGRRMAVLGRFVVGALLPALGLLALLAADLGAAAAQFRWHAGEAQAQFAALAGGRLAVLRWSAGWAVFLALATLPLTAALRGAWGRDPAGDVRRLATIFALAGLAIAAKPPSYPYYLVYFTAWPLLALAVWLPTARPRAAALLVGLAALLAWLPSAAWNGLRLREAVWFHQALDRRPLEARLAGLVPRDAPVTGSPEFWAIARRAGLRYEPLPWFGRELTPDPQAWLILIDEDLQERRRVAAADLAARRRVWRGHGFPRARLLEWPFTIYGPRGPGSGPPPD